MARRPRNVRTGYGNIGPRGNRPPAPRARPRARARGPLRPPPGLYDPALDAAEGAAQRGYDDLLEDTNRDFGEGYAGGRFGRDYALGREDIERGRTRGLEDLGLQRADLMRGLTRGREDYSRQVGLLRRDYRRLGRRQAEAARSQGVLSGGLAARAAAIRAGNMATDQQPLDTSIARLGEDTTLGLQAVDRAQSRLGEDTDLGLGRLGLGYTRAIEDSQLGVRRAGRENEQFKLDTNAGRVFAATQAGWDPPAPMRPRAPARRRRRGRGVLIGTAGRPRYGANF